MTEPIRDTRSANELRRQGNIEAALPIYRELWNKTQDKFAAAGLVNCLRKQRQFEEAIEIATEAYARYSEFDWCRNEYIWTLIQGSLYSFPEDGRISDLMNLIEQILAAKPDEIAYKITVFKVLKIAKKQKNWDLLNEWITKIDPAILDGYTDESTGWTHRELWYYYRVVGLMNAGRDDSAIDIIENRREEFFKKNKFFERLKAQALIRLGKTDEAEASYKSLWVMTS